MMKRKHSSLSGRIAIIHLSVFLLLVICNRTLRGHYSEYRHLIDFLNAASWVLIFPFGLVVQADLERTGINVSIFVIVIAANSAFWGLLLAWMFRRLRWFNGNTPQHPAPLTPDK